MNKEKILYNYNIYLFWICFIFALVFLILGSISLINISNGKNKYNNLSLFTLSSLWFLSFILLFIISYYALITNPQCFYLTITIYILALIFLTVWSMQLNNLIYANISIIILLISSIVLMYNTKMQLLPLGLIFVLIWIYIFFYINN
jgi:hypothetical protein